MCEKCDAFVKGLVQEMNGESTDESRVSVTDFLPTDKNRVAMADFLLTKINGLDREHAVDVIYQTVHEGLKFLMRALAAENDTQISVELSKFVLYFSRFAQARDQKDRMGAEAFEARYGKHGDLTVIFAAPDYIEAAEKKTFEQLREALHESGATPEESGKVASILFNRLP